MTDSVTPHEDPFLRAMRMVTSPVALVVCEVDGQPWGVTISSFSCLSVEPPTVMVALGKHSVAAKAIAETLKFSVSLLSDAQVGLARFGARGGTPKFLQDAGFRLSEIDGQVAAEGALCVLACEDVEARVIESHIVFTARVVGAEHGDLLTPLLYGDRQFRRLGADVAA